MSRVAPIPESVPQDVMLWKRTSMTFDKETSCTVEESCVFPPEMDDYSIASPFPPPSPTGIIEYSGYDQTVFLKIDGERHDQYRLFAARAPDIANRQRYKTGKLAFHLV